MVGAGADGTVMAYVTGWSLFFINSMGLRPSQWPGFPRPAARRLERLTSLCTDDGFDSLGGGFRAIARHDTGRRGTAAPCCFTSGRCWSCLRIEHTDAMNATVHPLPQIAGAVGAVSEAFR